MEGNYEILLDNEPKTVIALCCWVLKQYGEEIRTLLASKVRVDLILKKKI